ncbi:MAG: leucyl/phenylalanyl-tRNA--protein transferase [Gammaproteobacteria bacterium]|nr:leucyl/phenylalanyl-tRNA--protein transferase [Gammaproteobacteria bacterium]
MADHFPPVQSALRDPDGLLAIGGDLKAERLLDAYRLGIFPWFSQGQPILWWSPNPRCVLEPEALKISRSLGKTLRKRRFRVTFNQAFNEVVRACAGPRKSTRDTWLTRDMAVAYYRLHVLGHALSVECWNGQKLVGGLYGVCIGRIFFGESMFNTETDASKVALAHLAHELRQRTFRLIDCQVHSRHLQSLGAVPMSRNLFVNILKQECAAPARHDWPVESRLP